MYRARSSSSASSTAIGSTPATGATIMPAVRRQRQSAARVSSSPPSPSTFALRNFALLSVLAGICLVVSLMATPTYAMSLDRLGVDRNELRDTEQTDTTDDAASKLINSDIVIEDRELQAVSPAVAGTTDAFVLLPAGSSANSVEEHHPAEEVENVNKNSIEGSLHVDEQDGGTSQQMVVEEGGDMIMMESNDASAVQMVELPAELAAAMAAANPPMEHKEAESAETLASEDLQNENVTVEKLPETMELLSEPEVVATLPLDVAENAEEEAKKPEVESNLEEIIANVAEENVPAEETLIASNESNPELTVMALPAAAAPIESEAEEAQAEIPAQEQQQSILGMFADAVEAIEETIDGSNASEDDTTDKRAEPAAIPTEELLPPLASAGEEHLEPASMENEVKETESQPPQMSAADMLMESENLEKQPQPEVIVAEPQLAPEAAHATESEESAPAAADAADVASTDANADATAPTDGAVVANADSAEEQQQQLQQQFNEVVVLDEQGESLPAENVQIVAEPDREPEIEMQTDQLTPEMSAVEASESEKNRLEADASVFTPAVEDEEKEQLAVAEEAQEEEVVKKSEVAPHHDSEETPKESVVEQVEIMKDELAAVDQMPIEPLVIAEQAEVVAANKDEVNDVKAEDNKSVEVTMEEQKAEEQQQIEESKMEETPVVVAAEEEKPETEISTIGHDEKIAEIVDESTQKEEQIVEELSISAAASVEEDKPAEDNVAEESDPQPEQVIEHLEAVNEISSEDHKEEVPQLHVEESPESETNHVAVSGEQIVNEEAQPSEVQKHDDNQKEIEETIKEQSQELVEDIANNEIIEAAIEETKDKFHETVKEDEIKDEPIVTVPAVEELDVKEDTPNHEEVVAIEKEVEESQQPSSVDEKQVDEVPVLAEVVKEQAESIEAETDKKEETPLAVEGAQKIDTAAVTADEMHENVDKDLIEPEPEMMKLEEHEEKEEEEHVIESELSQAPAPATIVLADHVDMVEGEIEKDTHLSPVEEVSKPAEDDKMSSEEIKLEEEIKEQSTSVEIAKAEEELKPQAPVAVIEEDIAAPVPETPVTSMLTTIIPIAQQPEAEQLTPSIAAAETPVVEEPAQQTDDHPEVPSILPQSDEMPAEPPAVLRPPAIVLPAEEEQAPVNTVAIPAPSYNSEPQEEEVEVVQQQQQQQQQQPQVQPAQEIQVQQQSQEQHKLQPIATAGDEDEFNSHLRRYDGAQVWRIVVQNDKDRRLADELQNKYDAQLWKEVKQEVDYLLKPQVLADAAKHIRAANLSRIVLIDNLQNVIEVENPSEDEIKKLQNRKGHRLTWQAYHRVADIHDFFDYMAKTYPDICSVETIGHSVEKRPLKILKISNGVASNPGIWIDGGMHAREWIGPASVTYIANQLVEGWDDLPEYMKNINWYIHAVANPDGYEYSHTTDRLWRKNMRSHGRQCPGVDLNRNFGYKWGGKGTSANPCSQTYRGSKAFSEPESFYISKYISNAPRETFQAYLTFHSYGQYILYPWGYDYAVPADRTDLDRVARQAGTSITKSSGGKYTVGPAAMTLYPAAGGSDDWAKGIAGIKYTYTLEMGDTGRYGFILPASYIEQNGRDGYTFVETVARAIKLGSTGRRRRF